MVTPECPPLWVESIIGESGVVSASDPRTTRRAGRTCSHDGNVGILGFGALDGAQKGARPDDVQGGNTEQPLGVEHAVLLEDLGKDGDGRVDGVGDDQDHGRGSVLGGGLGQVSDDRGVGVLCGRAWGLGIGWHDRRCARVGEECRR